MKLIESERMRNDIVYDYIVNLTMEKKRDFIEKFKIFIQDHYGQEHIDLSDPNNRRVKSLDTIMNYEHHFNYVFHMLFFYVMYLEDDFMEEKIFKPTFAAQKIYDTDAFKEKYVRFCNGPLKELTETCALGEIVNGREYVEKCIEAYMIGKE